MEGYRIQETLASGSTSKIKKTLTLENEECAVKIMQKTDMSLRNFLKEVRIHRSLRHPNIVELLDSYEDHSAYYIVMRLGRNEMVNVIEVDVGLDPVVAHFYFVQLISAVRYLHGKGICHRDIKPENMLLDMNGNLLLSDFGFSTLFLHKKRRRRLQSLAGSFEYMAPEVYKGSYEGDMADIWSCGITLIVLLTGILPWDKPSQEDEKFLTFTCLAYHYYPPFSKVGEVLELVKKMLSREKDRIRLDEIEGSSWFKQENRFLDTFGLCSDPSELLGMVPQSGDNPLHFTQPDQIQKVSRTRFISSQPSLKGDVPEIYRLYMDEKEAGTVIDKVHEVLKTMIVPHEVMGESVMFSTTDTKRSLLAGEVEVKGLHGRCYVTLHKLKGDSHEFRKFIKIFTELFN